MMVSNKSSFMRLLVWQWKSVGIFFVLSGLVYLNWRYTMVPHIKLPTLPVSVIGAAIGIFVSFRTNSCYDRWWEGRKLWGRMINSSRHFCTQVLTYVDGGMDPKGPNELQRTIVRRHIAYVHTLRCLLRKQSPVQDEHVRAFLSPKELEAVAIESNATHALLHLQQRDLSKATDDQRLDGLRLQSLDRTIAAFLDIQGGCERIKKTPFPRGYEFIAKRLIMGFAILMPFALLDDLGWLAIPITVLICLGFELISEAGRVLEDPFTMFWNGLPLSAISRGIERNLRQRLGEDASDLPPALTPDEKGILM